MLLNVGVLTPEEAELLEDYLSRNLDLPVYRATDSTFTLSTCDE